MTYSQIQWFRNRQGLCNDVSIRAVFKLYAFLRVSEFLVNDLTVLAANAHRYGCSVANSQTVLACTHIPHQVFMPVHSYMYMEKSWRRARDSHRQTWLNHAPSRRRRRRRRSRKPNRNMNGRRTEQGIARVRNGDEEDQGEAEREREDKGEVSNAVDGTCIRWIAASFGNPHGKTPSCSPM